MSFMSWMNKLSIKQKLYVQGLTAVIFMISIGFVAFLGIKHVAYDVTMMYESDILPMRVLEKLKTNLDADKYNLLIAISADKSLSYSINNFEKTNANLADEYKSYNLPAEEKATFANATGTTNEYINARRVVTNYLSSGNKNGALSYYKSALLPRYNALSNLYEQIIDSNLTSSETIISKGKVFVEIFAVVLWVWIFALIIVGFILSLVVGKTITVPILRAVQMLTDGTEETSSASRQVSTASERLAETTTEQAASVQETSSTLEETASMVYRNKENSQEAATLAKQTKQAANQSNEEMHKMMGSMQELKKSSNEIAKIMKVIDEIAFQTNILSLNAAVEAARAGDAGKGFAVVAEEVRNLAQRSAQAAKETAVIIESNIGLSENGVQMAKEVQTSIESIDEQAKKVSELLDEIAVATSEQAQGIDQINKAVTQMEVVISSNAQTAEENANASKVLMEQVINIKEIVETLTMLAKGSKE